METAPRESPAPGGNARLRFESETERYAHYLRHRREQPVAQDARTGVWRAYRMRT